jgi:2-dehydro-3-deoxy-D-arabinonate dehydratase
MKIYNTSGGIVVNRESDWFLISEAWDSYINDDDLAQKVAAQNSHAIDQSEARQLISNSLSVPMQSQELWASGVTYENSKLGREAESRDSGADVNYRRVYNADRPVLFFKSNLLRTVPLKGKVRIRKDSSWDVPEPELVLVIGSSGKILGYTIGNDMSSRSIEGENPLYLPQAKVFDGCAALGPCVLVGEDSITPTAMISMTISRSEHEVYSGTTSIDRMKPTRRELVDYLFRECSFPHGALLMTGTGIVPPHDFTLQSGDRIEISVEGVGQLFNEVA